MFRTVYVKYVKRKLRLVLPYATAFFCLKRMPSRMGCRVSNGNGQ